MSSVLAQDGSTEEASAARYSIQRDRTHALPLTTEQLEILLDQEIHRDLPLYNIGGYVVLREAVDVEAFTRAFEHEIAVHDAFHLRFSNVDGRPVQYLRRERHELALHDLSAESDPQRSALQRLEAAFQRDLMRADQAPHCSGLVKLAEREYWYYSVAHHLVMDGWSYGLWVRRLVERYLQEVGRKPREVADVPGYLDYVETRIRSGEASASMRSLEYWREALALWPGPAIGGRHEGIGERQAQRCMRAVRTISEAKRKQIAEFAAAHGVQIHHLFACALYVYFAVTRNRPQLMLGLPFHNRQGSQKDIVGTFVRVNPCWIASPADADWLTALAAVKRGMAASVRHARLPQSELRRLAASLGHDPARWFDVQFNFLKLDYETDRQHIDTRTYYLSNSWEQTPLSFNVCEFGLQQDIELQVGANEAYFSATQARLLLERFEHVLDQAMLDPRRAVQDFDVTTPSEPAWLLGLGRPASVNGSRLDVSDSFRRISSLYPRQVAVRSPRGDMSYAELDRRSNWLAARLSTLVTDTSKPIALCMARGPEVIVAMVAATKLRRPYLPLDTTYPLQRLQFIVSDAKPGIVLTDHAGSAVAGELGIECMNLEAQVVDVDAAVPAVRGERTWAELTDEPMCIMYTSGSTGRPKGVVVGQAGVLRLVTPPTFMPLGVDTVMLQFCNVCFDVANFEIWGALLNGGTLALGPLGPTDLTALTRTIETFEVNTLWLTAGLFEKWIAQLERVPPRVRYVLAGGDIVPPGAVHRLKQLQPELIFINGYGPTENSIFSACWVCAEQIDPLRSLPIGPPVKGSTAYVMDARGRLAPFGEAGELWVGGPGVAIGYLNQPQLTLERFEGAPGVPIGERVYKTGDLARWREDGSLEYLGRGDRQVKIRGFRIEIQEIENHLRTHPDVQQAAVAVAGQTAAEKYLRAYVVTSAPEAGNDMRTWPERLAEFLRERVPEFMVPGRFDIVDELPVNANGKLDRSRLSSLTTAADAPTSVAAHGVAEEIQRIWAAVLRRTVASLDQSFLACGGNSLAALEVLARLRETFQVTMSAADFLQLGTIRLQARRLERLLEQGQSARAAIERNSVASSLPMSLMQESMWLADKLGGGGHTYNLAGVFRLRGALDVRALQSAFKNIMARHRPLRCIIEEQEGRPALHTLDAERFELPLHDLSAADRADLERAIAAAARHERCRAFDLTQDLPIRVRLARIDANDYLLFVTMHHIAVDGWSLRILYTELAQLYEAAIRGVPLQLPPLVLEHHDFAIHQRQWVEARMQSDSLDYWRQYLADAPLEHSLPLHKARPVRPSYRGRILRAHLDAESAAQLRSQAAASGVSLFCWLNTTFSVLVGEFGQNRDVVVGTPVHGRFDSALHSNIGCFINTLLMRTRYEAEQSLVEIAAAAHRQWLGHLQHDQLPYPRVLEALQPVASRSINPLFQLWFVLQPASLDALLLPGLESQRLPFDDASTKFDLMLAATESEAGLALEWLYAEDLFAEQDMRQLFDAYRRMLERVAEIATVPVAAIAHRLHLAGDEISTARSTTYDPAECLAGRVLIHARAMPDAPAVTFGTETVSYGVLGQKVCRLARLLRESGVDEGDRVAVCADRSLGGIVALLAVQLVGAAYLPVDPGLPKERLSFILADAQAVMLLTYSQFVEHYSMEQLDVVMLDDAACADWLREYETDERPAVPGNAQSIAYVIYTSGSSGTPKGVKVSRANLAHYVAAMCERHDFSGCRNFAISSAFHTDLGNTTLYIGLWRGACLHLIEPAAMLDGRALSEYVIERGIDVLKITPGHFAALCDGATHLPPVPRKLLIFGGERLRRELLLQIRECCMQQGCRVINHYGPTEATIGCITYEVDFDRVPDVVPLGYPLPGVSVRLQEAERSVARGAWGELVIGGPGVGAGYVARDDLTQKVFIEVEADGSMQRCYRTGDRVRVGPEGALVFGGRRDDQVKIRGFRIELGEIDARLSALPGVTGAATLVQGESTSSSIVSFVTPASVERRSLEQPLRLALPDYMIPNAILALDSLPLLGNGKVDRRALSRLYAERGAARSTTPGTATEYDLHATVAELLASSSVCVDRGFFEIGGNSLLATRLVNELNRRMDVQIPVKWLMENPSIRQMAAMVDGLRKVTRPLEPSQGQCVVEI